MDQDLTASVFKGMVCAGIAFWLAFGAFTVPVAALAAFTVFLAVGLLSSIDYKLMHVRHELHLVKHELEKQNDPQLLEIAMRSKALQRAGSASIR